MPARTRRLIIYLILISQVALIIWGTTTPTKFFNWVPYDQLATYHIRVWVDGVELSEAQVGRRYRLRARHRENRHFQNVIHVVRTYEQRREGSVAGTSSTEITFVINDAATLIWTWPADTLVEGPAPN